MSHRCDLSVFSIIFPLFDICNHTVIEHDTASWCTTSDHIGKVDSCYNNFMNGVWTFCLDGVLIWGCFIGGVLTLDRAWRAQRVSLCQPGWSCMTSQLLLRFVATPIQLRHIFTRRTETCLFFAFAESVYWFDFYFESSTSLDVRFIVSFIIFIRGWWTVFWSWLKRAAKITPILSLRGNVGALKFYYFLVTPT